MITYKISAMIFSAAILAACAQSPYQTALKEEKRTGRIVCEFEEPINSRIKHKTCRVIDELTHDAKEDILRTFEQRPDPWDMTRSTTVHH